MPANFGYRNDGAYQVEDLNLGVSPESFARIPYAQGRFVDAQGPDGRPIKKRINNPNYGQNMNWLNNGQTGSAVRSMPTLPQLWQPQAQPGQQGQQQGISLPTVAPQPQVQAPVAQPQSSQALPMLVGDSFGGWNSANQNQQQLASRDFFGAKDLEKTQAQMQADNDRQRLAATMQGLQLQGNTTQARQQLEQQAVLERERVAAQIAIANQQAQQRQQEAYAQQQYNQQAQREQNARADRNAGIEQEYKRGLLEQGKRRDDNNTMYTESTYVKPKLTGKWVDDPTNGDTYQLPGNKDEALRLGIYNQAFEGRQQTKDQQKRQNEANDLGVQASRINLDKAQEDRIKSLLWTGDAEQLGSQYGIAPERVAAMQRREGVANDSILGEINNLSKDMKDYNSANNTVAKLGNMAARTPEQTTEYKIAKKKVDEIELKLKNPTRHYGSAIDFVESDGKVNMPDYLTYYQNWKYGSSSGLPSVQPYNNEVFHP